MALGVLTKARLAAARVRAGKPFLGPERRLCSGQATASQLALRALHGRKLAGKADLPFERISMVSTRMNVRRLTVHSLFASMLILSFAAALSAQDDMIYWIDNYPEAIEEAKKSGKPLFLEFRCEP